MLRSAAFSLAPLAALAALGACEGTQDKRIQLVRVEPSADPNCGAPDDARTMIVRALGEFAPSESSAQSIALGEAAVFAIDRFPATTRVLEVEVLGFGGARRTIGRTDVFALADLPDEASIAVFMAPPLGVCPTGPQVQARHDSLLAVAGDGVLLIGGVDANGAALSSAELYDPASGAFVGLEDALYGASSPTGLLGASLTTLTGGNVVLVGGGSTAFQVFDPQTKSFGAPAFYREARARHAALALDGSRLFVAGGCSQLLGDGCAGGSELRTTSILDTASGELEIGPSLQLPRIDGVAYAETGVSILLVGGQDAEGQAVAQVERVFLDGRGSELIDGLGGVSVQAESGAIWMGMAAADEVASRSLAVLAPGAAAASLGALAAATDSGVVLTSLEDGSLLAVGRGGAQRLRSLDGVAEVLDIPELEGLEEIQTLRLRDGSVLLLGGREGASRAFIFRPSLVGPDTASVTASFSSEDLSEGLSASDATRVRRVEEDGDHLELTVDTEEVYVLVAGPVFRDVDFEAGMSAEDGSATLLFGWQSYAEHWKIVLRGEREVRLFHVQDGVSREAGGCSGKVLAAAALGGGESAHEVQLRTQAGQLRVSLDGAEVLACEFDALPEGRVGLGVEGASGTSLRVDIISLGR